MEMVTLKHISVNLLRAHMYMPLRIRPSEKWDEVISPINYIKRLSFPKLRYSLQLVSLQIVFSVWNSYFGSFSSRWSKSIYHNKVSRFWLSFCNSCQSLLFYGWVHLLSTAFNSWIVTLIIFCMSAQSCFSYRYRLLYYFFIFIITVVYVF